MLRLNGKYDGFVDILKGNKKLVSDDIVAVLLTTTHTPSDSHADYGDIKAHECTDADYSQQELAGKSLAVDGDKIKFSCSKINFTAGAPSGKGNAAGRYVYLLWGSSPAGDSDKIIGYIDLTGGGNASSTNGEFSLSIGADGLMYFTHFEAVPVVP